MQLKRKLPWILTGKSLLAVGSIAMVALALVTYTATVNISFNAFFVQGITTQTSWSMTTSSGTRYLPGRTFTTGIGTPVTPTTGNLTSFAFYTQTGQGNVKINLQSNMVTTNFGSFNIFVLSWNGANWVNATIFSSTLLTTRIVGGIDGTGVNATATIGYLNINTATQTFYAVQVNYALAAAPSGTPQALFNYTPSLN